MPGQLKSDAKCPRCGRGLLVLSDLTNSAGVVRTYYHDKGPQERRRRYPCRERFDDFDKAQRARRRLEVSAC